jgi:aryl-alcohol dehydrogenase-like predicted oxidoreductase
MRYRALGNTGIRVSEVSLGAWTIGTDMYGRLPREEAVRIIKKALDLGINLYDTSDAYGRGESERILGEVLRGYDVYVSTKVGYDIYSQAQGPRTPQRFDPEYLEFAVKRSLERLGRRYIDVLQLHNPPLHVIRDPGVFGAMRRIIECGLAMHIGIALGPEVNVLREGVEAMGMGYEVLMFVFNALEQEPARTLIRKGSGKGVGLMCRVPHASNVLTESLVPMFPQGDHRSLRRSDWLTRARRIVEDRLRPIATELGLTLDALAIKYVLSYPISTVLLTVTSVDELERYASSVDGKYLGGETLARIEKIYDDEVSGISP